MNILTSSILLLNRGDFATFTLVPPLYCNRVATCYCRPAIKVRNCPSQVRGEGVGVVGCSVGCCCCCQDIYSSGSDSGGNSNNDVFSYENRWSFLSKLITSYQLEG